jgi:hypothetical protein
MPLAGFEIMIPVGERPQTYSLDRTVVGAGPFPSIAEIIMCGVLFAFHDITFVA